MLAVMCKFGECYDKVFKTFIVGVFFMKIIINSNRHSYLAILIVISGCMKKSVKP